MADLRRQFVDGPFGQIHLRIAQPERALGSPLVCLHMFPQSGRNFVDLMQRLAQDRVVIAPDFPGYGESQAPSAPISAEQYASCVWSVLDQLRQTIGSAPVDLFGIHAGSKLAVEAAFQAPQSVRRLALCSAAILTREEIAEYWRALRKIPLDDPGTRFREFWRMQRDYTGDGVSLEQISIAYSEMLRGGEKYDWGHRAVFDYNECFIERLQALPHPMLLLNPADDLHEMTKRTLPYMSNGSLLNRPDWQPGFLHRNADQLAADLRRFLATEQKVREIA